jgi:hypothetical protein
LSSLCSWLGRRIGRQAELLDTQYFHVVFTVPQPVAAIALQNKEVVYNVLFRAASETLRTIAADPKHLGAQIGFFAVLHTWGQAGALRFPGDPSRAFALLLDPGRADKTSPLTVLSVLPPG